MNLTREDLMAAASAGIIPYKQVDTMLVFLRHREAVHEREAMQTQQITHSRAKNVLMLVLAIIGIAAGGLLAAINIGVLPDSRFSFNALDIRNLQWFVGLYALFTLLVVAWTERRRINGLVRVVITALLALAPLAVFASQQFHVF